MNTQTIYLHHSWKFHYGEEPDAWKKTMMILAGQLSSFHMTGLLQCHFPDPIPAAPDMQPAASDGIVNLFLPEKYRGKRIVLLFDGVYKESQVWFNSYYHGFHPNGYTPFSMT